MGRRLRAAGSAPARHDLRRHAGGRAGSEDEVRRRRSRRADRGARSRARPRHGAARRRGAALRASHLHRAARAARAALAPGVDVAILGAVSGLRWHDLECGGYDADLPLWRELAEQARGDVLDVGCGAGRVALDLARRGHAVTGLDHDAELVDALRERAGGMPVDTVLADARQFALGRHFGLALVPMQTVQLLGGPGGRAAFLGCARGHLDNGALLAVAVADALEGYGPGADALPLPDMGEHDGWLYSSQPVAVRDRGDRVAIERIRQTVAPDGTLAASGDVIELDRVDAATLEAEGAGAGFAVEPARHIEATAEHVGSRVVMLRAA